MKWTQQDTEAALLNLVAALVMFFVVFRMFMLVDATIGWNIPVGPMGMGEAMAVMMALVVPAAWFGTRWRSRDEGGLRVHVRQCAAVYAAMGVAAVMLVAQWGIARGGLEYAIVFVFFLHLLTMVLTNVVYHLQQEARAVNEGR